MTSPTRRALVAAAALIASGALLLAAPAAVAAALIGPAPVADAPDNAVPLVEYDGLLYVSAVAEGDIYSSLFSFDGTTFTSVPGSPGGVTHAEVFNGELLVTAVGDVSTPPFEYELYSYDGAGFTTVTGAFVSPNDFAEAGGVLFFQADSAGTWGIWQYDGTTTAPVPGSAVSPRNLSSYGGELYFSGDTDSGPAEAYSLYSYDPAQPAVAAAPVAGSPANPGPLVEFGGSAWFGSDVDLQAFDGTSFTAVSSAPALGGFGLTPFEGNLYFTAFDGTDYATYYYDGSSVTRVPGALSETSDYVEYNGALYFIGLAPTAVLVSITGGVATAVPGGPGYPGPFVVYQGKLYFQADSTDGDAPTMWVLETTADPQLASTGADLGMPLLAAIALLALGGAGVLARRTVLARRD